MGFHYLCVLDIGVRRWKLTVRGHVGHVPSYHAHGTMDTHRLGDVAGAMDQVPEVGAVSTLRHYNSEREGNDFEYLIRVETGGFEPPGGLQYGIGCEWTHPDYRR